MEIFEGGVTVYRVSEGSIPWVLGVVCKRVRVGFCVGSLASSPWPPADPVPEHPLRQRQHPLHARQKY